jgi:hypothetical protein
MHLFGVATFVQLRPTKSRVFAYMMAASLADALRHAAESTVDATALYDTLATCAPPVLAVLGAHLAHTECRVVLKAALVSLRASTPAARRAAVTIIGAVVAYAAPNTIAQHYFAAYLFKHLNGSRASGVVQLIVSVQLCERVTCASTVLGGGVAEHVHHVHGMLATLRQLWHPYVTDVFDGRMPCSSSASNSPRSSAHPTGKHAMPTFDDKMLVQVGVIHVFCQIVLLLQLLDSICKLLLNADHALVITSALELLTTMLIHPPRALHRILSEERNKTTLRPTNLGARC